MKRKRSSVDVVTESPGATEEQEAPEYIPTGPVDSHAPGEELMIRQARIDEQWRRYLGSKRRANTPQARPSQDLLRQVFHMRVATKALRKALTRAEAEELYNLPRVRALKYIDKGEATGYSNWLAKYVRANMDDFDEEEFEECVTLMHRINNVIRDITTVDLDPDPQPNQKGAPVQPRVAETVPLDIDALEAQLESYIEAAEARVIRKRPADSHKTYVEPDLEDVGIIIHDPAHIIETTNFTGAKLLHGPGAKDIDGNKCETPWCGGTASYNYDSYNGSGRRRFLVAPDGFDTEVLIGADLIPWTTDSVFTISVAADGTLYNINDAKNKYPGDSSFEEDGAEEALTILQDSGIIELTTTNPYKAETARDEDDYGYGDDDDDDDDEYNERHEWDELGADPDAWADWSIKQVKEVKDKYSIHPYFMLTPINASVYVQASQADVEVRPLTSLACARAVVLTARQLGARDVLHENIVGYKVSSYWDVEGTPMAQSHVAPDDFPVDFKPKPELEKDLKRAFMYSQDSDMTPEEKFYALSAVNFKPTSPHLSLVTKSMREGVLAGVYKYQLPKLNGDILLIKIAKTSAQVQALLNRDDAVKSIAVSKCVLTGQVQRYFIEATENYADDWNNLNAFITLRKNDGTPLDMWTLLFSDDPRGPNGDVHLVADISEFLLNGDRYVDKPYTYVRDAFPENPIVKLFSEYTGLPKEEVEAVPAAVRRGALRRIDACQVRPMMVEAVLRARMQLAQPSNIPANPDYWYRMNVVDLMAIPHMRAQGLIALQARASTAPLRLALQEPVEQQRVLVDLYLDAPAVPLDAFSREQLKAIMTDQEVRDRVVANATAGTPVAWEEIFRDTSLT